MAHVQPINNNFTPPQQQELAFHDDLLGHDRHRFIARDGDGVAVKGLLNVSRRQSGDIVFTRQQQRDWFAGLQWRFTF